MFDLTTIVDKNKQAAGGRYRLPLPARKVPLRWECGKFANSTSFGRQAKIIINYTNIIITIIKYKTIVRLTQTQEIFQISYTSLLTV